MFEWLGYDFMLQALVACTAIGLLLAYLGIHVVGRGIVFVDLALGQISSLGVAFAGWAGFDPVLCSMAFTLIGAAIFSRLQVHDPRLRLEAVIGIFYAVSSALTVLLIALTPHGDADIQDVLFGNVLAIDRSELHWMLAVFLGVAVVHALLGRRFFDLTYRKGSGETLSAHDHATNFVFYVLLALGIVFAIRAGGVIPVFAFLIIPPVAALAFARRTGAVVLAALAVAALSSFFGLHFSFALDLPAGASIVTVLGGFALAAGLFAAARRWRKGGSVTAAALAGSLLLGAPLRAQEAPRPPAAEETSAALAQEVRSLREQLEDAERRLAELERRLAELEPAALAATDEAPAPPPPAPAPAAPQRAALKFLDLSFGGLFAAGASTAEEEELRELNLGGHDPKNRGFTVQNLEMTLSGAVDPYFRADASLVFQIDEEGESFVEVEEAYLTSLSLPAGLQVKAGTYFSPFGRLNPQHPHQWDFANQPVVNGRLLGPDGLRGPGAQVSWLMPTPFYAEATFGVQNSNGETAYSFRFEPGEEFAGRRVEESSVRSPSDLLLLGRLATSFDLTPSFTILPGISYVRGPNGTGPDAETSILGLDFYGKWRPLRNDHGWPFFSIQAEWMERRYDAAAQVADDGVALPFERLDDSGGYLQGIWGFRRRWTTGLRFDWTDRGDALDPLRDQRTRWSTNLTFYPSEYSKLRLQYDLDSADHLEEDISSVFLQFEMLYGAHGGHKF
ncbi:MAG TPA: metal ABC transporter permease [Thermoanaerobaculia bacterium]|nr:metal ABC transporter permease [Thermoanaerobaculia bacterium]